MIPFGRCGDRLWAACLAGAWCFAAADPVVAQGDECRAEAVRFGLMMEEHYGLGSDSFPDVSSPEAGALVGYVLGRHAQLVGISAERREQFACLMEYFSVEALDYGEDWYQAFIEGLFGVRDTEAEATLGIDPNDPLRTLFGNVPPYNPNPQSKADSAIASADGAESSGNESADIGPPADSDEIVWWTWLVGTFQRIVLPDRRVSGPWESPYRAGNLELRFTGPNTIEGVWDGVSSVGCDSPVRDDSDDFTWGKIRLNLVPKTSTDDADEASGAAGWVELTGAWEYCATDPDRTFSGSRTNQYGE